MVEKWQEGYDVVDAVRFQRKGDPLLKESPLFFYRILKFLSNIDISKDTGDFRLPVEKWFSRFFYQREQDFLKEYIPG